MTALAWQALATIVAAAAFLAALIIGLFQLRDARKLRLEQARPYVVVDLLPGQASTHLVDLVITNIGKSPAYDLRINFDPEPERVEEFAEFKLKDARILTRPTPMFAPGREIRMFFDTAIDRYESDLPMSFQVTTEYRDSRGQRYREVATIDFDVRRGAVFTLVYGVHEAVTTLKDIANTLQQSAISSSPVEVVHGGRGDYQQCCVAEAEVQRAAHEESRSHLIRKPDEADGNESTQPPS